MGPSRIYVTTLCLAAVVLLPVPGFSASPNAAPQASADKAKDDGCGRGGQEPSPRAEREPKRQNAGPKPKDCSRGQGGGPESDDPSNEESDMKSNGGFAAALLLAVAAGSAGATDLGISFSGCHGSSSTPGVPSKTVPRLFCVGPIKKGADEVIPKVCTDSVSTPAVPGLTGGDVYCSVISSLGDSVTTVTENADCAVDETGVVITRASGGSFSFDIKRNGASLQGFPIGHTEPSEPLVLPICYANSVSF